jgi:outer membrane receptor protein involved in Fe transport
LQSAHDVQSGRPAADTPSRLATLGGTFVVADKVDVTPTLRLVSSRPRTEGDSRAALPGHGLFNLTVRHVSTSKHLELRAIVENLFDAEYSDPSPFFGVPGDYPRAGRSIFIDAKYRF